MEETLSSQNKIGWVMEMVVVSEHYHRKLVGTFFPLMTGLALLPCEPGECQYLLYFLTLVLMMESCSPFITCEYSKDTFLIVYTVQHVMVFVCGGVKLLLSYLFIIGECSMGGGIAKITCWLILCEAIFQYLIQALGTLHLSFSVEFKVKDYRSCRKMIGKN